MGRIRALPLVLVALAGVMLLSGASSSDPSTPEAPPGHSAPFLGTAVIGNGRLLAAVDPYGSLVDLRFPGPAGPAQIDNPFARQAAGSVAADTGIVARVGSGTRPKPLWQARRLDQRYLPLTNVLRTGARIGGATVAVDDAAAGRRLSRRVVVRGRPGEELALQLDLDIDLFGGPGGDSLSRRGFGLEQRDGARVLRCRAEPRPAVELSSGADASARLRWHGRGALQARLDCAFGGRPLPGAVLRRRAAAADRSWIARRRPLGAAAPPWAERMYARSLLVLRALTDSRSGASVAAARDHWSYVWPRDAGAAAIALDSAGYTAEAGRVARFLLGLDIEAGARFRGDASPVLDGRVLPGDAAGWVGAAAKAAGLPAPPPVPGAWRDRGDYGERRGDRGDYLANAIAGGAGAAEVERLFAAPPGLQRRAADRGSGLDSAAAWAVRPFPQPPLFPRVRRSLLSIAAQSGRFGVNPSQDWPGREAWTAPAAWSAWSLAALGERPAALWLIGTLRRASTSAGTIPERVNPSSGLPLSATPLGWSHAFAALALRQLYPRR